MSHLKPVSSRDGEEFNVHAAIVDYGLGNLFSVKHACHAAGIEANVTADPREILAAEVVILPGVGAFGDAMTQLRRLDLDRVLQEVASSGTLLMGICLGMQLLMTESEEFGAHRGLGLVEGSVVRFREPCASSRILKVPQVGWNRIYRATSAQGDSDPWRDSPLMGLAEGTFMYFVHSYYAQPQDPAYVRSLSRYGDIEFCSGLQCGSIFASQFHPERSGPEGLRCYRTIAILARARRAHRGGDS